MKAQLNLRKGSSKEGFRILKRFGTMKEAREYLNEFLKDNVGYMPTAFPDVYKDNDTNTQLWLSKQFTPSGDYRYRKLK